MNKTRNLREAGLTVVEGWACEVGRDSRQNLKLFTKPYPHAIFYDFEAFGDKNQRKEPTGRLKLESAQVPISVSVGDTFEKGAVTHICDRNPKELRRRFVEELERRGEQIRNAVRGEYIPEDYELIPKKRRFAIDDWCN